MVEMETINSTVKPATMFSLVVREMTDLMVAQEMIRWMAAPATTISTEARVILMAIGPVGNLHIMPMAMTHIYLAVVPARIPSLIMIQPLAMWILYY